MKKTIIVILMFIVTLGLVSCNGSSDFDKLKEEFPKQDIYYQIFVRSFADSDDDGVGDLNGITNKLDYLSNLGITAVWLTPIHPTITYHGYEIADYYDINPEFGTMEDLQNLIDKADQKGIKIIMDMVFNHTWEGHEWYVDAFNNLDSPYRDYYIFPNNAKPGTSAYETFPFSRDLNLRSEALQNELTNILKFYLDKGISGFRFDAVKHYFEKPYDPNYSNNPTFEGGMILRNLKQSVIDEYPNAYFIGEYFEYNVSDYRDFYLGADSMLDFEISRIFQNQAYSTMNSVLNRIYENLDSYNPNYIDAPFITNHDLDRFASMNENLANQKFAASVLLTLPGNPYIYYGEELGMKGKRLENQTVEGYVDSEGNLIGVYDEPRRQPFLWDQDDSALTTWFPLRDGNENLARYSQQLEDENSLLNHYQKFIQIRRDNPALMFGNSYIRVLNLPGTISFIRTIEVDNITQTVLVVHNFTNNSKIINASVVRNIYGTQEIPALGTYIAEINSTTLEIK